MTLKNININKKKQKTIFVSTIILTFIASSISFILSDSPDKVYLNPIYVDILVLFAGLFLITDSFINLRRSKKIGTYFYSIVLKIIIGTSIITIHLYQFLFDMFRNIKF